MNYNGSLFFVINIVWIFMETLCDADVPKSQIIKCAVCRSLINEIHEAIEKVDPRKTVEVGSFRINPDGKQEKMIKKYAGSETHMTDLLESICGEFKDYAQARHKETNRVETIKLVIDGKMNPKFGEYEMIQDPDLNKSVQYHCESIVEDFEEELLRYFSVNAEADKEISKDAFCSKKIHICESEKDEL